VILGILANLVPVVARAQPRDPIGPYVVDARGLLARFKEDGGVAQAIDVEPSNLPTRGLGVGIGGHWYPTRLGRVTLGIGGEFVWARGSRTGEQDETATEEAPTVTTRFSAIAPHVSVNFGHGDGWSYLSGGLGRARLTAERADEPFSDGGGAGMTHYGGGARWFTGPHLAFTFDVRFYAVNASDASGTRPAFPRTRFMVISVGASLR
jgi:hypothetical protein